jgi:hypothetical protein
MDGYNKNMLTYIIGWLLIVVGLFWLIRPKSLKNFFSKKVKRRRLKIIIVFIFIVGSFSLDLFFRVAGLWLKLIVIVGFLIVFNLFLRLTSKAQGKISDYLSKVPVIYYRLFALVFVGLGALYVWVL